MPASTFLTFILLFNNGGLEHVERDILLSEPAELSCQERPGRQEMVEDGKRGDGRNAGASEGTDGQEDRLDPAARPPQQDCLGSMWPMLLLLPVIYFLLIRPQQKEAKARRAMLAAVKKGEKVVTSGGIHAEVVAIHEQEGTLTLKIGSDAGQRIKVDRSAITRVKRDAQQDKQDKA